MTKTTDGPLYTIDQVRLMIRELQGGVAPRLLDMDGVAVRLAVPIDQVRRWHRANLLPKPYKLRGRLYWREVDIELWEARAWHVCQSADEAKQLRDEANARGDKLAFWFAEWEGETDAAESEAKG